jgi:glucose-6-phosphate isomerase
VGLATDPFNVALGMGALQSIDGVSDTVRRLSDMQGLFADQEAVAAILAEGDPVIYEFSARQNPSSDKSLSFGLTRIRSGTIGGEYYMTRGHFHRGKGDEVYVTLNGQGVLLLQTRDGQRRETTMAAGTLSYVPTGWGHRAVNVGSDGLVFLSVWSGAVDHDYETIARRGFPRRVISAPDGPVVVT